MTNLEKDTNLTVNDIRICCEDIYNKVFQKEDYELCMNYLNTKYYSILALVNLLDKDRVIDEIIQFETKNSEELSDGLAEEMRKYQNPTSEDIIAFYSNLAFTLASFRIKYKKEYLLAKYCQKAFDVILNDKKNAAACEQNTKIISETLIDFSYASGSNNMSFRIRNIYGDR